MARLYRESYTIDISTVLKQNEDGVGFLDDQNLEVLEGIIDETLKEMLPGQHFVVELRNPDKDTN